MQMLRSWLSELATVLEAASDGRRADPERATRALELAALAVRAADAGRGRQAWALLGQALARLPGGVPEHAAWGRGIRP